jgi:predicted Rdx family selenoprotein
MPVSPMIEITYCRLCGWGLRAGWMAQENVCRGARLRDAYPG